jgi:hypothetical protein
MKTSVCGGRYKKSDSCIKKKQVTINRKQEAFYCKGKTGSYRIKKKQVTIERKSRYCSYKEKAGSCKIIKQSWLA